MTLSSLPIDIEQAWSGLRQAQRSLRSSPQSLTLRNEFLKALDRTLTDQREHIIAANSIDLGRLTSDTTAAFRDRLTLTPKRLEGLSETLQKIAAEADPVEEVFDRRSLPNGLLLKRIREPIGVILLIFEARPNVVIEALAVAIKSGNAMALRGGKEAVESVKILGELAQRAWSEVTQKFNADSVPAPFHILTDSNRELVLEALHRDDLFDLVIPRGGEGLCHLVSREARMPILKNDRGLCHIYVDSEADLEMAIAILINAKTQRPGVCNSAETLLLHAKIAESFLALSVAKLTSAGVVIFGCPQTISIAARHGWPVQPAGEKAFDTEYLDLKLNVAIVDQVADAISHIALYSSHHSESIITRNESTARRFQREVDSACVYWNASTRFTDGFEFGLGGEIGISTQRVHARGPLGLRELTCLRYWIDGTGQIR